MVIPIRVSAKGLIPGAAADALTHPYLDEGRLRFHSCMCSCCSPGPQGRNFCPDLEPECPMPFDLNFEKSLNSVSRVKGGVFRVLHFLVGKSLIGT